MGSSLSASHPVTDSLSLAERKQKGEIDPPGGWCTSPGGSDKFLTSVNATVEPHSEPAALDHLRHTRALVRACCVSVPLGRLVRGRSLGAELPTRTRRRRRRGRR